MKTLLKIVLVLLAIVVATYYFLIDGVLKGVIETEGSKALRAKLDVASVDFHLLPLSITLSGVQATNPRAPLTNLVQADTIFIALVPRELIAHKILAEEVQAHGLRFHQPRTASGAIAGLTPPPADTAAGLGGISLPDPQQLLAQGKQRVQGELAQVRAELTALRGDWQTRLKSLPDQARIDGYRQRAQALRQAGTLEKIAGAEQLRRDVKADLSTVRQLEDRFKQDSARAQQQLAYARALPQRELDNLLAGVGGGAAGNITGAVLAGQLQPLLDQVLALANATPATGGDGSGGAQQTPQQQWPVLARKVLLDGRIDLGSRPLHFNGSIDNVTPQPALWDVITTFALNGSADQPGKFSADGSLDYRRIASSTMRFQLSGFPVEQLALSSNKELGIVLGKALADIKGRFALTGNQVDFKLGVLFSDAVLDIAAADNSTAQAVATALRNVTQLDFDVLVSGNVRKPTVTMHSNLDSVLADAVGREVKQQAAAVSEQLRAQLQQELAPDLAAIQQLDAEVRSLQQSFIDKQQTLNALSDLRGF